MTRGVESATGALSEALFEPVIRLGVTGISQAGKTVFITSLVANLLDRGRMPQLVANAEGRIVSAYLQPQPDDTLPRFEYETHLAAVTAPEPRWPASTTALSELRLSLRIRPAGLLAGLKGPRTVHIDIVDYPGEWLLDLGLMDKSYEAWTAEALDRSRSRPGGAEFLAEAADIDAAAPHDEATARRLTDIFTEHLAVTRSAGFSDCSPGRFLMPGALEGSPVLTFVPLSRPAETPRGCLWREMQRRYEAYRQRVVKPFFRDHLSRIDRQIVLADVLGAIHSGPRAFEDLRRTMAGILTAFRPGRNGFFRELLLGRRVERILFAATKADHLHHSMHPRLTAVMQALVDEARRRADFAGAGTSAMSLASIRATVEETRQHQGQTLDLVRGTLENGKQAAFWPGDLPEDVSRLMSPAREGATEWLDGDFGAMRFRPATQGLKPGEGPPHIRLDRAVEFLIGDLL
ncbi:YcjX family protein [Frigidibacter sp. ROC022]|uniref:YcjX family protein n=1 Tax=Frigidibacter sp. ROC022 TaxID=2971796 RepID=UPI00215B02EE|nr:YcjX family protein [Frigidibacter sp. ROC022]MCR8725113.1 YcjX family protein [Frigidibacter sp. ROC022]